MPVFTRLMTAGLLAVSLIDAGLPDAARAVLRRAAPAAEAVEEALGGGAAAAVTLLRTAEGRLAYLDGSVDEARRLLARAADLARTAGHPSQMIGALVALADAERAAGDRPAARAALDQAGEVAEAYAVLPATLERLATARQRTGRRTAAQAPEGGPIIEELTERELSVLRALQGPGSQRDVAASLFLSINTVKGYTKSLYRKLGVASRAGAVERGRELGLI
jgi:LuxR family maltose regulon positive regulatory protein